jgi:hypothetical protein
MVDSSDLVRRQDSSGGGTYYQPYHDWRAGKLPIGGGSRIQKFREHHERHKIHEKAQREATDQTWVFTDAVAREDGAGKVFEAGTVAGTALVRPQ